MTTKTAIALSPTPENLVLAARCRKRWGYLHTAGSRLITQVLDGWATDDRIEGGIVLVARVADAQKVRGLLKTLGKRGKEVMWIAPSDSLSVSEACEGLPHVTIFLGATMSAGLAASGLATTGTELLSHQLGQGRSTLTLYCKYKIAMSLIAGQAPAPLVEAADLLAGCATTFNESSLPLVDRRSVEAFAAADLPYLAGYSPPVSALKDRIRKVGGTELSVLVLGETGTGKENVAFYLHEFSQRRAGPLVAVNCAGLDETFLRSELFGHIKGAFTGATDSKRGMVEEAKGGTLFLDEIAEMPLPVQAALLRFLQDGKYIPLGGTKEKLADVRVIAATQPDLHERVKDGRFRKDLYYRLADVELRTPALREVPTDLRYMIRHLLFELAERHPQTQVHAALAYFQKHAATLQAYSWPGNVRELAALVKRHLYLGDDVIAELQYHPTHMQPALAGPDLPTTVGEILPLDNVIHDYVTAAWNSRGHLSQRELAEKLGKSLNTVKRIRKNK